MGTTKSIQMSCKKLDITIASNANFIYIVTAKWGYFNKTTKLLRLYTKSIIVPMVISNKIAYIYM